jgi:hypothetical protein
MSPAPAPSKLLEVEIPESGGPRKDCRLVSGYPHGAAFAEQEGAGNWREIPVSHSIQQQYSPAFEQGLIPRCDGPVFPRPTDQWRSDPRGPLGPVQPSPQKATGAWSSRVSQSSMRGPQHGRPPVTAPAQTAMWSSYPVANPDQAHLPAAPRDLIRLGSRSVGPRRPPRHLSNEARWLDWMTRQRHDQSTFLWGTTLERPIHFGEND